MDRSNGSRRSSGSSQSSLRSTPTLLQSLVTKAQASLDLAKSLESLGKRKDALEAYTSSAESFFAAIKATDASNAATRTKLKSLAFQVLDKAEQLKAAATSETSKSDEASKALVKNVAAGLEKISIGLAPSVAFEPRSQTSLFRETSTVNGITFKAWQPTTQAQDFSTPKIFTDPNGLLKLSQKQIDKFGTWKRCGEITSAGSIPYLMREMPTTEIIQDTVTDCSFVASLCICAAYENLFRKRLISSCIYPQDSNGHPIYSPSGKYLVKLIHNGSARAVVVDDMLPVSKEGALMCTFTSVPGEYWASIIEKAYMKLMGGYDFPGSNSSIDLYALTGWLPEHIFINSPEFNAQSTWDRFVNGQRYGDCLVTIGTGQMPSELASKLGLVPTHNYAVLETRRFGDLRLLKVKNPWNHRQWKGKYSHLDQESWTPELLQAFEYNQLEALKIDNGMFWIDYDSVCAYFDSIYLNWNPGLFPHNEMIHAGWKLTELEQKQQKAETTQSLARNPQYALRVDTSNAAVWILLTKHTTDTANTDDYIALHVYDKTDGSRVYESGKPMKMGVYVNSPHVLVRFNAPRADAQYTLVVCRHQKHVRPLYFSLSIFSTSAFTLTSIPLRHPFSTTVAGQWTDQSAGGNGSNATYMHNPQYSLIIPNSSASKKFLAMLEAPQDLSVHIELVWSDGKRVSSVLTKDIITHSKGYKHGLAICEASNMRPGNYTIIVSTFDADKQGSFTLTVESDAGFKLHAIPAEGAGMRRRLIEGYWTDANSAGAPAYGSYDSNPQCHVNVSKPTVIRLRLQARGIKPTPAMNVTVFKSNVNGEEIATSGPYTDLLQGVATKEFTLWPGEYVIVPSTYQPRTKGKWVMYMYSDNAVVIESIK